MDERDIMDMELQDEYQREEMCRDHIEDQSRIAALEAENARLREVVEAAAKYGKAYKAEVAAIVEHGNTQWPATTRTSMLKRQAIRATEQALADLREKLEGSNAL